MNFTVGNKKVFESDPNTGQRLVTLADLNEISDFTIEVEGAEPPQWESYDVDYTDFSAASTSGNVEILSLPAGGVIHAVVIELTEKFEGGAISAYTISVGITGTVTKYANAYSVFATPSATTFQISSVVGMESLSAATSIKAYAASTDANLNAATAGAATIHVLTSRLWKD